MGASAQYSITRTVCRAPELLPVASIPLTYFTHTPESCRTKRLTEQTSLAFGGINNSAVKTVVKYIWEAYGKQAAENILSSSLVTDMPIGAYQAVRQQQANTALCPSLYGLRADEKETFFIYSSGRSSSDTVLLLRP